MNEKKLAKIALVKAKQLGQKAAELSARKEVIGANIYVQDTQPDDPENWVWIDTNGIDQIIE